MYKRKIAVNTRFLIKNKLEGIGWFTYETLLRITQAHPEIEFHFFFDRPFDKDFVFGNNVVPHVLFPPARHPFLWYIWFEWAVSNKLMSIKPDLFISTDGQLSLRTNVPTLLVIHDLAFEHYPHFIGKVASWYYRYYTPLFAKKAKMIATVSAFSKQDLVQRYQIDPAKIDVVYNGSKDLYKTLSAEEIQQTRTNLSGGQPYFLYVGAIHPRKNIKRIFLAFDAFKQKNQGEYKLVVAGRKAWKTDDTEQTYEAMQFKNDVIFTGHLLPDDLRKVIGSAFCMVYVSLFEGFGIPILEAMNCDIPVITSNISSMPEVAGDAAMLVDPSAEQEIALAMERLYTNEDLRQQLIEKGRVQKTKFSWDATSEKLWNMIAAMIKL